MNDLQNKPKLEVRDAHVLDKKIPRDLIILYQGKPYITKAGLAWKMNYLFGGNNWGITNEIVEKTPDYVLIKSTLKVKDGMEFSNFGEASKLNVTNPMMHRHLLHLAVTRAENRVIRTATACGYTSVDEMDMESKHTITDVDDGLPITEAQKATIISLKGIITENMTQGEAKEKITELSKEK